MALLRDAFSLEIDKHEDIDIFSYFLIKTLYDALLDPRTTAVDIARSAQGTETTDVDTVMTAKENLDGKE